MSLCPADHCHRGIKGRCQKLIFSFAFEHSMLSNTSAVSNHSQQYYEGGRAKFNPKSQILPLIIAFPIVFVNGFILYIIVKKNNLHSVTNKWLASLAGCDLLMGLVGVSLYVACNSTHNDPTCFTSAIFIRFISIITLLHILGITIDRFIYILYPLRYHELVNNLRTHFAMAFFWLVSFLVVIVQLSWTNLDIGVFGDGGEQEDFKNRIYDSICTLIFFLSPLFFMVYAYARVLSAVHKQCKRIKRNNTTRRRSVSLEKFRERRAIVIYIIILVTFLTGWTPYFLVFLQQSLGKKLTFSMSHKTQYFFDILRIFSSLVRPVLYTMGKYDLRKAAKVKLWEFRNLF